MRIYHRHGYQVAHVGNSDHTHATVVIRYILDEPVDCVVGVRTFIRPLGIFWIVSRAKHLEGSVGSKPSADVLKHKNVAVAEQVRTAIEPWSEALVGSRKSICQPFKKHRQGLV